MNSKLIIAIDTSTNMLVCSLAQVPTNESGQVGASELAQAQLVACGDILVPRAANTKIIEILDELLCQQDATFEDVAAIVCGKGPGSFTGVRIGVATAKGLAIAKNLPLYEVSTLDAIAWGLHAAGIRGVVGVVDDAMRKEVYPGIYTVDDEGPLATFTHESVVKLAAGVEAWAKREDKGTITLAGDGLVKYADAYKEAGMDTLAPEALWYPRGAGIFSALVWAARTGKLDVGDPALALPVYTRLSDAEENERKRLGIHTTQTVNATGVADGLANEHLALRPMSINDVAAAAALEKKAFPAQHTCWGENLFAGEFDHEDRSWWVAYDWEKMVGYAGGQLIDGDLQILDIAVDPQVRGQGIARKLLARITYDALVLGATSVSLEVAQGNAAARRLYDACGFKQIGMRKNYYGMDEHALIMQASLPLDVAAQEVGDGPEPSAHIRTYPRPVIKRSAEDEAKVAKAGQMILSIESSCDETAVAIIDSENKVIANIVATQIDFHARFGGVVPEIASRKHVEAIVGVYEEALAQGGASLGLAQPLQIEDIAAVAVTQGPGLVGALVVGIAFAKGVAYGAGKKLIGVNHLEGHLYANLFETPDLQAPFIATLVSGGHTMLVYVEDWGTYKILGQTLDDAAGEAFDKVAKALGLGYPGGPIISRLAETGDPEAIAFPRAMLHSHDYKFSLSGLKTSVMTYIQKENNAGRAVDAHDLAASFQAAVVDVQVAKARSAVKEYRVKEFCAGGGVSANPVLRAAYKDAFKKMGVRVTLPPTFASTDNAAMIGLAAWPHFRAGNFADWNMDANAHLSIEKEA